ncbi:MAG: cell division protein FtsL [Lachnospiraceae bacterium]|nr:cell division protein FtsL [Lachnospiraceae bacterium]
MRNERRRTSENRRQLTYIEGNTVRRTAPQTLPMRPELVPVKVPSQQAMKNRAKSRNMPVTLMLSTVIAIGLLAACFTEYLSIQSRIQQEKYAITKLERELSNLKMSNDEEYARIMGSVDLEEIKATAMNELGMTYPDNEQIVSFEGNDTDYVRQHADIPGAGK